MQILYGTGSENYKDITLKCLYDFMQNGYIVIPPNDEYRATVFGDPCFGTIKNILVKGSEEDAKIVGPQETVIIRHPNLARTLFQNIPIQNKLAILHNLIILAGGSLQDELPEQTMAIQYVFPQDRVLELGANIGRNTLVLANLLEKSENLVTFETDPKIAYYLRVNREINKKQFHIECAALSSRPLIQNGWQTEVWNNSSEIPSGFFKVNTITYNELRAKYANISFNVLVLDCEGAFYHILQDMPEILTGIEKILMECDYTDFNQKVWISSQLIAAGFEKVYSQPCKDPIGLAKFPLCWTSFYEVWTRSASQS